jgi:flagellar hook-basal body complex protein FliE
MAINGLGNTLAPVTSAATNIGNATGASGGGFADMLKGMVNQTVNSSQQAEALTTAAAQGQNVPLNNVIQAVSQAELTLQTLITVRDRAVEAYQQIQQMPI